VTIFVILALLVVLLLSGMPIFAGLGLTSLIVLAFFEGTVDSMADIVFASLNNPLLATIPMFALMAHVMIKARVVDDLFDMANTLSARSRAASASPLSCRAPSSPRSPAPRSPPR
jgi:C4-dicarboxylate transporter, DctM subunit